jgi:hypothetical protein
MAERRNRKLDLNTLAKRIVDEATGEVPREEREKDPNAVALGRKGGLKGGKARAQKLSPERRAEIARKAARARWSPSLGDGTRPPRRARQAGSNDLDEAGATRD